MSIEMVFNDLSLATPAATMDLARDWMKGFVNTLRDATQRGVSRTLRVPANFYQQPLSFGYTWRDWQKDANVEREQRQYLQSLATKAPFLQDLPELETRQWQYEFQYAQRLAEGLGMAYLMTGLAVSLLSNSEWNKPDIELTVTEILVDSLETRREIVRHAGRSQHIENHRTWLEQMMRANVESGAVLWNMRAELFPRLTFCDAVEDQMQGLPKRALSSIIHGLFTLNDYCARWADGIFNRALVGCTTSSESVSTLNDPVCGQARLFRCPDGIERVFSLHAKLGDWRIHFRTDDGPGEILIGYTGKHLPLPK
jgi:hypothetical protein